MTENGTENGNENDNENKIKKLSDSLVAVLVHFLREQF